MRSLLVFPFALATFPILTLYVANSDRFPSRVMVTPLLLSLGGTALLAFGLSALIGNRNKASLLTGLVVFFFWTYGHAAQGLFDLTGAVVFQGGWFILVWAGLLTLAAWQFLRTNRTLDALCRALNFATCCLVAIPLIQIAVAALGRPAIPPGSNVPIPPELAQAIEGPRPDIYYIIVDAYARADVLKEVFDFDNQAFIDSLEERGFRVATLAHANYCQTDLSLASSLNMAYLDDLLPAGIEQRSDRALLMELIANSRAIAWLNSLGYRVASFATGFHSTELTSADVYLAPESGLSEFNTGLVRTTPLGAIETLVDPDPEPDWRTDPDLHRRFKTAARHPRDRIYFDQHRARILNTLDRLPEISDLPGPFFVLAHLIAPHPPFVLDEQGRPLTPETIYCHDEAKDLIRHSGMTPESYKRGYLGQLSYLNKRLLEVIDALLEDAGPEPVIIIQADHGSGFLLNQDKLDDTDLQERFSIFAAARFPGGGAPGFGPDISPVNILRLLFRTVFRVDLARLPDRSFYSTKTLPYLMTEVTAQIGKRQDGPDLMAVHGSGHGSYWAVGLEGNIGFFDGSSWWRHPGVTGQDLYAVWALDPNRVWVAGAHGVAAHFDGKAWQTVKTGTERKLTGLWASGADDLWATGERGILLHFDGDSWHPFDLPGGETLSSVWGSGREDVHAVGARGAIAHFDGQVWTRAKSPTTRNLHSVTGLGPDAAWAVGDGGLILSWDGSAWTEIQADTSTPLYSVSAASQDEVWAVGRGGITLRFDGKIWKQIHSRTVLDLYAIWCSGPNGAMAVGAKQTVITH